MHHRKRKERGTNMAEIMMHHVTDELVRLGLDASVWDSGGNIECVQVNYGGSVYIWGTADETWGADVYSSIDEFENGFNTSNNLMTGVDSDEVDARIIAFAIVVALKSDKLATVVESAIQAFFAHIASAYPEVKSGDLSPSATFSFHAAARKVAVEWLAMNLAGDTPKV